MLADGLCREGRRSIYGEEVVDTQKTDNTDDKFYYIRHINDSIGL